MITEKQALDWFDEAMKSECGMLEERLIAKRFLEYGKSKGYIEQSALERAREHARTYRNPRLSLLPHQIDEMIDLYEQAIKEG